MIIDINIRGWWIGAKELSTAAGNCSRVRYEIIWYIQL